MKFSEAGIFPELWEMTGKKQGGERYGILGEVEPELEF
jgi:hypothetical protein